MNYFVKRNDKEYGPYTLAALQQYVTQGSISRDDMARSEAMTEWVTVSTIIGNLAVSQTSTGFGATTATHAVERPMPPKLHWGVVLALTVVTFGIIGIIWLFVQAVWVRKVEPKSNALYFLIGYVVAAFAAGAFEGAGFTPIFTPIFQIGGFVLFLIAVFGMRRSIEAFNDSIGPGGGLSGVMTFFFNVIYFQYHLNDIRELQENQRVIAAGTGV
jgi:hypothetical protein